ARGRPRAARGAPALRRRLPLRRPRERARPLPRDGARARQEDEGAPLPQGHARHLRRVRRARPPHHGLRAELPAPARAHDRPRDGEERRRGAARGLRRSEAVGALGGGVTALWRHMRSLWPRWTLMPIVPIWGYGLWMIVRGELRWDHVAMMIFVPV